MRTTGKQCGLAATGVYQPSLRSPWLAARDFETDVLRFMEVRVVPFTNNQGENDLPYDESSAEAIRLLSLPGRSAGLLQGTRLSVHLPQAETLSY